MDETMKEVVAMAKRKMEKEGDHPMTFFIVERDGGLEVVMALGGDRDQAFEKLQQLVHEFSSERYFIVFAGWKTEDEVKSEVLIVSEFDRKVGTQSLIYEVARAHGRVRVSEDAQMLKGNSFNFWNVWSKYQIDVEGLE